MFPFDHRGQDDSGQTRHGEYVEGNQIFRTIGIEFHKRSKSTKACIIDEEFHRRFACDLFLRASKSIPTRKITDDHVNGGLVLGLQSSCERDQSFLSSSDQDEIVAIMCEAFGKRSPDP